jgi:hypothetical protein
MPGKERPGSVRRQWRRAKREGYKGSLRAFIKIMSEPERPGKPTPWSQR